MTNEEIENKVAEAANKLLLARRLSPEQIEAETEVILLDFAASIVSQAYEEAARAECYLCNRGIPTYPHPRVGWAMHAGVDDADATLCKASMIRSLKDSLVEVA